MTKSKLTTIDKLDRDVKAFVSEMESADFGQNREYNRLSAKYDRLSARCNSLWSNPADRGTAYDLGSNMRDTWNSKQGL